MSSGAARTKRADPHRGRRGAKGSAGSAAPRWRNPPLGRLPATWRAGGRVGQGESGGRGGEGRGNRKGEEKKPTGTDALSRLEAAGTAAAAGCPSTKERGRRRACRSAPDGRGRAPLGVPGREEAGEGPAEQAQGRARREARGRPVRVGRPPCFPLPEAGALLPLPPEEAGLAAACGAGRARRPPARRGGGEGRRRRRGAAPVGSPGKASRGGGVSFLSLRCGARVMDRVAGSLPAEVKSAGDRGRHRAVWSPLLAVAESASLEDSVLASRVPSGGEHCPAGLLALRGACAARCRRRGRRDV